MNNAKWTWFAIGYQCLLAYCVSLCVYQIGTFLATGVFGVGFLAALVIVAVFLWLLVRPYKNDGKLRINLKGMAKV